MNRRQFLGSLAAAAAPAQMVDTHVHLFDTTRPQGVPWPSKGNTILYQPALPDRLRRLATPWGITGAIAVECSPLVDDNQWLLDTAARDSFILGVVGNLDPGKPEFGRLLDRFRRNPLFLGIRYGNLWGRDLGAELGKPEFVAGMKALADAGLELDTANPSETLIADVVRLTDRVPNLRVVLDHLAQLDPPQDAAAHARLMGNLRELARRPNVYVKGSAVLRRVRGEVPTDPTYYRPRLDELWGLFGPDRLFYGSDWPNSDQWGTYAQVFAVVKDYFGGKGAGIMEKFFWKNALAAYRWKAAPQRRPQ